MIVTPGKKIPPPNRNSPSMRTTLPCLLLSCTLLQASPTRPAVGPFRIEENWTLLRQSDLKTQPLDAIKYIPLGRGGDSPLSLTLGGEFRHRYERYTNDAWGRLPEDKDGYHLTRFMVFGDLRYDTFVRSFVELKSNNLAGKSGPPKPPDVDTFDLHQAFLEFHLPTSSPSFKSLLRIGRQELNYGSARLVTFRDGPNTRQSFDTALARVVWRTWKVDAFFARPAETDRGVFDDQTNTQQSVYGLYAVAPLSFMKGTSVDLYFLGFDRDNARFVSGTAEEDRYSLGARLAGRRDALDFNFEAVLQWGRFGNQRIRAWTVASDTGYTWKDAATAPRAYLRANAISGDSNPQDRRLGTFNPLYPRGSYFGDIGLLGPANLLNLHPGIQGKLGKSWAYNVDAVWFWRDSIRDGIYGPSGSLQFTPPAGVSRFLGTQLDLGLTWTYSPYLSVEFTAAKFLASDRFEEQSGAENVDYLSLLTRFRF
ncbi:MAG: alginate export family protein [Opitutaceae bacterium]|nr:alginate export family protein [Opitutaceae bacterium]